MKVLFDLQSLQGQARRRGMGRYSLGLAKAMANHPSVSSLDVLLNAGGPTDGLFEARRDILRHLPDSQIHTFEAPWPWRHGDPLDVARHEIAEQVRDAFIRQLDPEVVVVGSLFELPFTAVVSIAPRERPFTAVVGYDLLPFTEPSCAFPASWTDLLEARLGQLANADLILAISDFTAAELARVLGGACPKVQTIWGAPAQLDTATSPTLVDLRDRRGVVCAGGGGGRKNEQSTLQAYSTLPAEVRSAHPLTIQGYRLPEESESLDRLAAQLGLNSAEYRLLDSQISEDELANLIAGARVLAMPSLAEGLGLPVLEAWAAGTPAIGSATTSLGQLIADPRWTFDPMDYHQQARILHQLLADDTLWMTAHDYAVAGAARFTWEASADLAVRAIQQGFAAQQDYAEDKSDGGQKVRPLSLVVPSGAVPQVQCGLERVSLDVLLAEHFQVTVTRDCATAESADRVLLVLGDPADTAGEGPEDGLGRGRLLPHAVVYAASESIAAETVAAGPAEDVLGYALDGAASLLRPSDLGPEIFRAALGVIAADAAVHRALAGARSAIPQDMLFTAHANGSRSALATAMSDFIESAYRRRKLTLEELRQLTVSGALQEVACNRGDRAGTSIYCYFDATQLDDTAQASGGPRPAGWRWAASLQRELTSTYEGRVFPVSVYAGQLGHDGSYLAEAMGVLENRLPNLGLSRDLYPRSHDILLAGQMSPDVDVWSDVVRRWLGRGGRYVQVVQDLLPIHFEDFFFESAGWYRDWLNLVGDTADLVICPTQVCARGLSQWFIENPPRRMDDLTAPRLVVLGAGFDMNGQTSFPRSLRNRPRPGKNVLVVGTISAHRGIDTLIAAAQSLWAKQPDVRFRIVGRAGNASAALLQQLKQLSDSGCPLDWIEGASDEVLRRQYMDADLLVVASRCEGSTLPVVEALAHGTRVLARDIPALREVLGEAGEYFRLDGELGDRISHCLQTGEPIRFESAHLVRWQETTQGLLGALRALDGS